jgi:hypothetical protein
MAATYTAQRLFLKPPRPTKTTAACDRVQPERSSYMRRSAEIERWQPTANPKMSVQKRNRHLTLTVEHRALDAS